MIKTLMQLLLTYTQKVLGAQAEAGSQLMYPGFKTNSSYTALGAAKYIIVRATAANQADQAVSATASAILGVMQNSPDVGEAMSIAYAGRSKVVAGGSLSVNAIITTNGSGRAAAVTSGDIAIGRVLEAAGADGDVVTAVLFHPVRWQGAA